MWQIINGILGNIMFTFSLIIYAKLILNKKIEISKTKLILIMAIFIIISTIIYLKCIGTTKTIFMTIVNYTFFRKTFKIQIKKQFFLQLCV